MKSKKIFVKSLSFLINLSLILQLFSPFMAIPAQAQSGPYPTEEPSSKSCGSHSHDSSWSVCDGGSKRVSKKCNNGTVESQGSEDCPCDGGNVKNPLKKKFLIQMQNCERPLIEGLLVMEVKFPVPYLMAPAAVILTVVLVAVTASGTKLIIIDAVALAVV